jgi:hypothetical protein
MRGEREQCTGLKEGRALALAMEQVAASGAAVAVVPRRECCVAQAEEKRLSVGRGRLAQCTLRIV